MAINYLNSLDLNKNEILQGVIENQPNDAAAGASPVEGQLYFNTTNHVLMQYNGASWEEAGGGVETLTTTDGTYIDLTPNSATDGAVTVTADLSAVDGTPVIGKRFLTKDNTWAVPIISDQNTTYTLPVSAGTAVTGYTVADIDLTAGGSGSGIASKVTFAGKDNNILITETTLNNGVVKIALTDNVTIADSLTVTQDASIGNDLSVTGASSLGGNVTAGSDLTVSGDLTVTSDAFFNGSAFDINANTTIDFGANKITNVVDPTNPQDAATKQYVDDATVGGLIYQGGYDASTNTPSIDRATGATATSISAMGSGGGPKSATEVQTVATTGTGVGLTLTITLNSAGNLTSAVIANRGKGYASGDTVGLLGLPGHTGSVVQITAVASAGSSAPAIGIETGWTYTVIADGTFYGEIVRVGDVLIAETDDPGALANWTTVQNNIDLASLTQVGIGNVNAGGAIDVSYLSGTATVSVEDSTASNKGAVIVDGDDPITVTYNSGTATVGIEDSAAAQKGAVIVSGGTGIDVAYASGTATVSLGAQSSLTFTNTGPASAGTTYEITAATHGLGADSSVIMVQLVEVSSGGTVYTDVVRGASGLITMTFAASQAINTFRALLQKIG